MGKKKVIVITPLILIFNNFSFRHPHPTATTTIPKWPIATSVPFEFMQIGNENGKSSNLFKINKGLYEDRANFWMKVREDYKLSRWNGGNLLKIPTILIMFCTFIANLSV